MSVYKTHPRLPWTNWDDTLNLLKSLNFYPKTLIDVGVATDTMDLYKHFPHAEFLFVEPLVEFEPYIKELCERFNGNYEMVAAGPKACDFTMMVTPDLGGSSLFTTRDAENGAYAMTPRTVPMVTLDSLWNKYNLQGPALLKIDVQGGEIEVLKGAKETVKQCEVVIMEVGITEHYVGRAVLFDYVSFMKEQGFVVWDIMHMNYNDYGLLAETDMLFVKENGDYRAKYQSWFTEQTKKNAVLHDNYKGVRIGDNTVKELLESAEIKHNQEPAWQNYSGQPNQF